LSYDNVCKYLAEQYPAEFVRWLLAIESTDIEILKTELTLEPIRADALTFLRTANQILHLEFQTLPYSEPAIPFRMLDYSVRLKRQYRCTVTPPQTLLTQIAEAVARISNREQRQNIASCAQIFAGLRFEKDLIRQLFREELMQGSVIYQDILQQGKRLGRREGEANLILRLLTRRLGTIDLTLQQKIRGLSTISLDKLGEALLDFSEVADLVTWLRHNDPREGQTSLIRACCTNGKPLSINNLRDFSG